MSQIASAHSAREPVILSSLSEKRLLIQAAFAAGRHRAARM